MVLNASEADGFPKLFASSVILSYVTCFKLVAETRCRFIHGILYISFIVATLPGGRAATDQQSAISCFCGLLSPTCYTSVRFWTKPGQDKEDEEDRVERKNALLEAWRGCQEGLPDELQSMYSGKSLGINGDAWQRGLSIRFGSLRFIHGPCWSPQPSQLLMGVLQRQVPRPLAQSRSKDIEPQSDWSPKTECKLWTCNTVKAWYLLRPSWKQNWYMHG